MKTTSFSCCQVCSRDFEDNEIVYYVVIDNSIVCTNCASEASKLTDNIQTRIFEK